MKPHHRLSVFLPSDDAGVTGALEAPTETSETWAFPAPLADGLDDCGVSLMEEKQKTQEKKAQFSVFTGD